MSCLSQTVIQSTLFVKILVLLDGIFVAPKGLLSKAFLAFKIGLHTP